MKKYFLYIFLAIASFFAVSAQTAKNDVVNFSAPVTIYISSGQEKHTFEVERAITKAQQARGMMFREVMNKNSGMLFEFKEPKIASMWMKNTYIPLDIFFLDENMDIVGFKENNEPYSLKSIMIDKPSRYVLEMNGGSRKRFDLKLNEKINFIEKSNMKFKYF